MTTFDTAGRTGLSARYKSDLIGIALALLFSPNTLFVMIYSLAGVAGNSLFSGSFLIGVEASIFMLTVRRMEARAADFLFAAFLFSVAVSFALNGPNPDPKENALLILSLAAYPACRFIGPTMAKGLQSAFLTTNGIMTCAGVLATAYALYDQWPVPFGKPIVLGSYAGAANFLGALGFVILALVTRPLTLKRSALISALLFVPILIFAAALVRFTFVAILIGVLLAAALSAGRQRIYIAIVAATFVVGIAAGILVRFDKIPILITFMTEQTKTAPVVKLSTAAEEIRTGARANSTVPTAITPPSCSLAVNMRNSFAERKALWQDATYLIPYAGVFGFGLDGFMKYSCLRGFPVHNSIMEAFVEFGWLGGAAFLALILLSLWRLFPLARRDDDFKFFLCTLVYTISISGAHGRTSRDIVLFALLGMTAGILNKSAPPAICRSGP